MITASTGGSNVPNITPTMTSFPNQQPNLSTNDSIGMIIPPPDIRSIIVKTAQFVAKNGLEFEQRVLLDRGGERKFSFLLQGNPYRPYYESKVKEYLTGEVDETTKPQIPQAIQEIRKREAEKLENKQKVLAITAYAIGHYLPGVADSPEEFLKLTETGANLNTSNSSKLLAIDDGRPVEPPSECQFTVTLPFAAAFDIDVIKLTAQYVARNGQKFLAGLGQRERGNAQFAFLRATHPLFAYFTALVDAYARVLMPERNTISRLKEDIGLAGRFSSASSDEFVKPTGDPNQWFPPSQTNALLGILERVTARYRWEEQEERKRQEKAKEENEDREQMHSLDWHEFVVVEAIQFTEEDESLPLGPPIDISQLTQPPVIAPMAPLEPFVPVIEPRPSTTTPSDTYVPLKSKDAAKVSAFSGEPKQGGFSSVIGADANLPTNAPIMVVSNYVRQPKKRSRMVEGMMKCPITGQMVPTSQMSEHLRILLLDPKWKEQKDALVARARKESAFAPEGDFEANLANFVVMRPDLFGSVDDECESTYVQIQSQPT